MATNKNALRKELEASIRKVNEEINTLEYKHFNKAIDDHNYEYAKRLLDDNRDRLLRIMEICVQRNRF